MDTYIVDTTLRDGEQSPGVIFKHSEKFEIASLLNKLGIDEVEVGTPAMGVHEQNIIREIAMAGFAFKTISWCRALKKDIELASKCKTDAVSISFPVSKIQLDALGKDRVWVKAQMHELIKFAKQHFKFVYVGLQDASRCEREFLIEAVDLAIKLKADRVRIADTVGVFTPLETMAIFADLSYEFPGFDFEFHAHNDLGMATANAFVALKYGARGISGTINGIGERAGNVPIEELMMALHFKHNESKYHLNLISQICSLVAACSHIPIPKNKPLIGSNAFAHETGVHVRSVLKDKLTYQPFDESIIGMKSNKIVIGKHSGKAALMHFFNKKGEKPSLQQIQLLHKKIQDNIMLYGKVPTEQLLMNLFTELQFSPVLKQG